MTFAIGLTVKELEVSLLKVTSLRTRVWPWTIQPTVSSMEAARFRRLAD